MSYAQAMKWGRKHPKGTRQPVLMHTNSGFWPSRSYLESYQEYRELCDSKSIEPMGCEEYYRATLRGGGGDPRI